MTPNKLEPDEREEIQNKINKIWSNAGPGGFDQDLTDFILADRKTTTNQVLREVLDELPEKVADNIGNSKNDIDWGKRLGQNAMLEIVTNLIKSKITERGE